MVHGPVFAVALLESAVCHSRWRSSFVEGSGCAIVLGLGGRFCSILRSRPSDDEANRAFKFYRNTDALELRQHLLHWRSLPCNLLLRRGRAMFQFAGSRASYSCDMDYLSSASEWLQRHAVHLLLRHGLSHIFANQVDLDQLKVQLRRHALRKCMTWHGQLTDIEISKDFLNQHAVRVFMTHTHLSGCDLAS